VPCSSSMSLPRDRWARGLRLHPRKETPSRRVDFSVEQLAQVVRDDEFCEGPISLQMANCRMLFPP